MAVIDFEFIKPPGLNLHRRMRRPTFFASFADQVTSASAHARGKAMYSACLKLEICSVHKLPWAPRMNACTRRHVRGHGFKGIHFA